MKKVLLILCLVLTSGTMILAADDVVWGSFYGNNNLKIGVNADFGYNGSGSQIGISPEAELMLWKPVIGSIACLDAGASVLGRIGLPVGGGSLSAGAGLTGNLHLGFRGLELPASEYIERLDIFAGIGLKYDFISSGAGLGFVVNSGVNYFLSDSMAVGAHYSSWGDYSGGGVSVFLKIGKTPAVKGIDLDYSDEIAGYAVQPYLLQFYTFYYSAHLAGGYYPGSFREGQSCTHRISTIDSSGETSFSVSKAYLKDLGNGRKLWSLKYDDGEESFYYEYITDSNDYIKTVYYKSEDTGLMVIDASEAVMAAPEYVAWEDYSADSRANVSIDVEAGRFSTTEYSYTDANEVNVNWWVSEEVPGDLVSYKMDDGSEIVISELIDISTRNTAKLYK